MGQRQKIAYNILENLWDNKKITCIYKHTSNKIYNRWPDEYDLGINFLYKRTIPTKELQKTRWINFNVGQLPQYGGNDTAYHAIIEESKEFGSSIYYMSPNPNEADIIESINFSIKPSYTAKELINRSKDDLLLLFIKWIPTIISKNLIWTTTQKINYYPPSNINQQVLLTHEQKKKIRAISDNTLQPVFDVNGTIYTIKKIK